MKKWLAAAFLAALVVPSLATQASAQERGQPNSLVITAVNLMAEDERHQKLADEGGDPNTALPGDVIHYQLTFTNVTEVPVREVEIKDPLPGGLHYVGGSAGADRADVVITYSIDGGKSFTTQPMIEQLVEGERVVSPAPPELYTHIRWLVSDWVQPGAQVTAEFKARLPAKDAPEEPGN